jgi:hypothetical protein
MTMRIADAIFGALVVLLLLAHGARADEYGPYVVCDDERPCHYFKTAAQMKQYVEAQNAEFMAIRRKTLDQLSLDERDCSIPVLIDLIESSGALREKGAELYVDMGDGDIDALSRQTLDHQGIHVLPGSSRERQVGVTEKLNTTNHTKYWHFSAVLMSVGSIPDTFEIGAGYHCGSLCMGRLRYTVKVDGRSCTILSKRLLSVS